MKHLLVFLVLLNSPNLVALAQELSGPEYVLNEPFSSVVENKHEISIGDGRHITNRIELHLYRDSKGRTRRETYSITSGSQQGTLVRIEIRDPVAGVAYDLEPQSHVASAAKISYSPPLKAGPESSQPTALWVDGTSVSTEDLGTQTIDGCQAHGRRITRTTPAGVQGNDRTWTYIQEEWNCIELQMLISFTRTDPRFGNTVMRLTKLDRGEPDPSLFQVPVNYKVVESGSSNFQQ